MSVAIVPPPAAPAPTAVVLVTGEASPQRERAARALAGAGFAVRTPSGSDADGARAAVIIVAAGGGDSARLGAIRAAAARHGATLIVAVMPAGSRAAGLRRALLAGARGIVLEGAPDDALAATVAAVLAGQLAVPDALGRQIAPQPLSHREKEVLDLVVLGLTNQQIAARLFLAESTIKTHLSSAFRKLDARSRAEAVARLQDGQAPYGLGTVAAEDADADLVPAAG